jgi:hypothetical protein
MNSVMADSCKCWVTCTVCWAGSGWGLGKNSGAHKPCAIVVCDVNVVACHFVTRPAPQRHAVLLEVAQHREDTTERLQPSSCTVL